MTTNRIEKKITSKQLAMRMCKNVEGYLDWICHSAGEKISKMEEDEAGAFKKRTILKKTVAMLMTRAISRSKQFEKFVELAQEKGGSAHKLLKKMLVKRSADEYVLRIFIRKPKHKKQLFKLVNGYPNPLYPEHAMVSMNGALLKEEKIAIRKELKCLLDAQDSISPETISGWILPVIHNSLTDLDGAALDGYLLEVHPVQGLDSYSCLLQYINADNKDEVHEVTLDIKMAIEVNELPDKLTFQHPYPRLTLYERKGRQMLKDMYAGFQDGTQIMILCSDLYKSAAKLGKSTKRKKQDTAPAMTRLRLQMIERSRTAIFGKRRIEDKKVWTMDFGIIETSAQQSISKTESSFHKIEEALELYNNLSKLPSKIAPPLNEATQVAVSLWLFKNTGTGLASDRLFTNFVALLHLVHGCIKGNFCPSFFMPSYNTMAPKITETNPMGVAVDDMISNLSDFDESDEEKDSSDAENNETKRSLTGESNQSANSDTKQSAPGETNQSAPGKPSTGDQGDTDRSKSLVRRATWLENRERIKDEIEAEDTEEKETGKDKSTKEKKERSKETNLTAEEKLDNLISCIESNDFSQVVDLIGYH